MHSGENYYKRIKSVLLEIEKPRRSFFMLFMGIDIGTQGVRTVVADEKGAVEASDSVAFKCINAAKEADRYEQLADDWWEAAAQTIRACAAQLKDKGLNAAELSAISVDGTSGTIVPLDQGNRPLCNAFMYNDMRAKQEANRVHEACEDVEKKLGLRFNASFSLPRILFVREQLPHVYEKTARFAHQADYIVGKLCSEFGISDYSNALKTGYDLVSGRWPDAITALGLDIEKFPRIVAPGAPIGRVSRSVADSLGLSENTRVVGGSTDGYASALAAGAVKASDWASIIGTTLVLKGVTQKLIIDPSGSSYSHKLPSGAWMLGGASNIGGRCLNNHFEKSEFDRYNKTVDDLTPTGILSYPLTGTGERFPFIDPQAKEFIVGNVEDKRVLYAALMEGVGYAERLAFERMAALGCTVGDVVYTSGGACRSDEWLRIRASILNRQLKVPAVVDAAMGSAMLAAANDFGTLDQAAESMIRFEKTVDPVSEKVKRYDALYKAFYRECKKRFLLEG